MGYTLLGEISIEDLILDFENPRISSQTSEKGCIESILKTKSKEDHILNLASDIANNGLTAEHIIVSKHPDFEGKWIVRDGNRRITSIKLLINPQLAPSRLNERLSTIARENIPLKINCCTYDSEKEILEILHKKHSGTNEGIGQIPWGAIAKTRYSEKTKESNANLKALNLIRWAQKNSDIEIDEDTFSLTNLTRIMTKDRLIHIGFELNEDMPVLIKDFESTIKKVCRILTDLQYGYQTSRSLDNTEDLKRYVEKICQEIGWGEFANNSGVHNPEGAPKNLFTQASKKAEKQEKDNMVPAHNNTANDKQNGSQEAKYKSIPPNPQTRKKLLTRIAFSIPKTETKAIKILCELKEVDHVSTPIAAAMLLRSLIEFATDYYMHKHKLSSDTKFASKVKKCAYHMHSNGLIDENKKLVIDKRTTNEGDILSVNTLHGYVHSGNLHPDYQILNSFWDEIEFYINECWR